MKFKMRTLFGGNPVTDSVSSALDRLPLNIKLLNGLIDGIQSMLLSAEKLDQSSVKKALPFATLFWLYGTAMRDLLRARANDGAMVWNAPALAALCRPLLDAYVNFYYFVIDVPPEREGDFRELLLKRQYLFKKRQMLSLMDMTVDHIAEAHETVSKQLETVNEQVLSHSYFEQCDAQVQKEIRSQMDKCVFESFQSVLTRSGVQIPNYDVVFRYLSQWVHATPFALDSLKFHRAEEEGGAVNMTIPTGIAVACGVKLIEHLSELAEPLERLIPEAFWEFLGGKR